MGDVHKTSKQISGHISTQNQEKEKRNYILYKYYEAYFQNIFFFMKIKQKTKQHKQNKNDILLWIIYVMRTKMIYYLNCL